MKQPRAGVRQNYPRTPGRIHVAARANALPSWVPLVLTIALLIAQQALVVLRALPPSLTTTIAVLVFGALITLIPQILQAITQYQAARQSHERARWAHEQRLVELQRTTGADNAPAAA